MENIYTIILLADLKPFFKDTFLRKMDKDDLLASTLYRKPIISAENFQDIPTINADEFILNLNFDQFGNLNEQVGVKGNEHNLMFNRQSRGRRTYHKMISC